MFTIESHLANVALAATCLRSVCSLVAPSPDQLDELEIGVAEALNNIVKHGYGDRPGQPIIITAELHDRRVVIQIRDQGKRIPAELLEQARTSFLNVEVDDLDSIPESGMGLHLIVHSADVVDYSVQDDINTLKFEKSF